MNVESKAELLMFVVNALVSVALLGLVSKDTHDFAVSGLLYSFVWGATAAFGESVLGEELQGWRAHTSNVPRAIDELGMIRFLAGPAAGVIALLIKNIIT